MKEKPTKSATADAKSAQGRAREDAKLTKNTLGPVKEQSGNLRKRAAWFKQRAGEQK